MESYGTLTVYAYTSDARIPISDAVVRISKGEELLAEERTDRSGYITPVRIPAPAPSQSLSPDQGTPFATVQVHIRHPDYEEEKVSGVQVFPNIITVQAFRMIPVSPQYPGGELDFDTPSQNL